LERDEIQRTRAIFERIEPFMGDRACSRDTEGGASTFRLLEVQGVSRLSQGIEVITVASFLDHLPIAWMSRLLLILGLAACGSDPEPRTMELRGTYSGTTVIVSPEEGGSLGRCNANASDGENPGFSTSGFDELTGEFNVLGSLTIVASDCIHPERGEFADGRATLTSAGGDKIMTEFRGSVQATDDPDIGVGRGEHQVVGGSGRFSGVGGLIVCEFRIRTSTSEIRGTCKGEITV
jgi:hypothetical protein